MKIIFTLLFIFSLISPALSAVGIEAYEDHNYHSHDHSHEEKKKDSGKSEDCPHFHFHCSSLCLGVLLTANLTLHPVRYFSRESHFSLLKLSLKDFANSLYRPPIA